MNELEPMSVEPTTQGTESQPNQQKQDVSNDKKPPRTIEELESLPLQECMELAYNIALLDKLKSEIDAKRAELLKEMVANDIHSVENEYLKISVSPATVRKGAIDTAKMAKEGIDIEKYRKKDSNVKESIRITLRGAK